MKETAWACDSSEIDPANITADTSSIGLGPLQFDVDMARTHGWTEEEIAEHWRCLRGHHRTHARLVSARQGHTRKCDDCECWTFPDQPCHRCADDEMESARINGILNAHQISVVSLGDYKGGMATCSCGWTSSEHPNNAPLGEEGFPIALRAEILAHHANVSGTNEISMEIGLRPQASA